MLGDNLEIAIKHNAQIIKHCIKKQKLLFSPTLCYPMYCSMPGFPVFHHLLESAQIHVYCVNDAIQPSTWPTNKGQTNHRKGPIGKQIKNLCPRMPFKRI